MTDKEKQKVHDLVQAEILDKLEKARMEGTLIGWYTACTTMYEATKDMHSIKAVRKYLKDYAESMKAQIDKAKEMIKEADTTTENQS